MKVVLVKRGHCNRYFMASFFDSLDIQIILSRRLLQGRDIANEGMWLVLYLNECALVLEIADFSCRFMLEQNKDVETKMLKGYLASDLIYVDT